MTALGKDGIEHLKFAAAAFPLVRAIRTLVCRETVDNASKKLCMHIPTCTYAHAHMHMRACAYMYICQVDNASKKLDDVAKDTILRVLDERQACAHAHVHIHTCTHGHVHTLHTCTHAHVHTCTHAHMGMHYPARARRAADGRRLDQGARRP